MRIGLMLVGVVVAAVGYRLIEEGSESDESRAERLSDQLNDVNDRIRARKFAARARLAEEREPEEN